ncbi:uncharacterized protein DS421_1g14250 [Arachis hypogaea]|nr:uncharacterized protein DS421_1g14250 [Arachis hypogaea]
MVVVFLAFPVSLLRLPFPSLLTLRYPDSLPQLPRSSTITAITMVSIEAEGGRHRAAPLLTSLLPLQPPFLIFVLGFRLLLLFSFFGFF